MPEDKQVPDIVKSLAEAVSQQTKIANRHWLTLAGLNLLVAIPRQTTPPLNNWINLPFNLGTADITTYYTVTSLLVSVITIGFCSAHAQVIRAQLLFDRAFDIYKLDKSTTPALNPRDLFDTLRLPNISRVAPLALIARGNHQFYSDSLQNMSDSKRILTGIYYVILKMVSFLVYVGLPLYALYIVGYNIYSISYGVSSFYYYSIMMFIIVGGGALMHVIINEIWYFRRVIEKVFKKKLPE